jgi:thimet oligopeptidase
MSVKKFNVVFFVALLVISGCKRKKVVQDRLCSRVDLAQITSLIPKTSEDIYLFTEQAMQLMDQALFKIDQIDAEKRSYSNTLLIYEQAFFLFFTYHQTLTALAHLSSDSGIQTAAHVGLLELDEYSNKMFKRNLTLYQALEEYEKHGKDPYRHTKPIVFFLDEKLKQLSKQGMNLSVAKRADLVEIEKEINQAAGKFCSNALNDRRHLIGSCEELKGLPPEFFDSLAQDDAGNYLVPVDAKNFAIVMQNCQVSATRKEYYLLFYQQGYPQNEQLLKHLQAKRHEMAKLLGFDNFAAYQMDDLMIKTPKKADAFLWAMVKDVQPYDDKDFAELLRFLPAGVSLTADRKIEPWDYEFALAFYRKKHFKVNDAQVAKYFPLNHVLPTMLTQLAKFFHVEFELQEAQNLWTENIVCYRVRSLKNQAILGYLFFDLYQRSSKCSTGASQITMIPAIRDDCSFPCVGASVVVANLTPPTELEPTLLAWDDVAALLYQMGNALHSIFGATRFTQLSGTQVVFDFTTVVPEVLHHWLTQKEFLQIMSCHVETGQSMNRGLIELLIARQKFGQSYNMLQQLFLGLVSLNLFEQNVPDNHSVIEKLYKKVFKHIAYSSKNYFEVGFLPFAQADKASVLYAYPWSKVIAADFFAHIKTAGIDNYDMGMHYVTEILSPGGSRHPYEMVKRFLGRGFHRKAFLEQL